MVAREVFIGQHMRMIAFGPELYEINGPISVVAERGFLGLTYTWDGRRYSDLNELKMDLIEARKIRKAGTSKSAQEFGGPWKECGRTADGGKFLVAPVGTPEPKEKCNCVSGASCGGTGYTTAAMQGVQSLPPKTIEINGTHFGEASEIDLRLTKDGTYWVAKTGQPINSMYGWRRIGLDQISRDHNKVAHVYFAEPDLTLRVRKVYGSMEEVTVSLVEDLYAQQDAIARRIAEAETKQREMDIALSREPVSDEDTQAVIYFTENFNREFGPEYTYVAVQVRDGKWYVTGKQTQPFTWAELCTKYHNIRHGEFWIASGWAHAE
jgi:hypothetical protein